MENMADKQDAYPEPQFRLGQMVYSKSGRDKGLPFVIKAFDSEYLYLTDGDVRKLERPKKKKIKHVQKTNYVDSEIESKLKQGDYLNDADIRRVLKLRFERVENPGL